MQAILQVGIEWFQLQVYLNSWTLVNHWRERWENLLWTLGDFPYSWSLIGEYICCAPGSYSCMISWQKLSWYRKLSPYLWTSVVRVFEFPCKPRTVWFILEGFFVEKSRNEAYNAVYNNPCCKLPTSDYIWSERYFLYVKVSEYTLINSLVMSTEYTESLSVLRSCL